MDDFWGALKRNKRIIHIKHRPEMLTLLELCAVLSAFLAPPLFRVRLGHVSVDERVVAVAVEDTQDTHGRS